MTAINIGVHKLHVNISYSFHSVPLSPLLPLVETKQICNKINFIYVLLTITTYGIHMCVCHFHWIDAQYNLIAYCMPIENVKRANKKKLKHPLRAKWISLYMFFFSSMFSSNYNFLNQSSESVISVGIAQIGQAHLQRLIK